MCSTKLSEKNSRRIFFWQQHTNIHEAGHIRMLCEIGEDVTVVAASGVNRTHAKLGVGDADYGIARLLSPEDGLREICSTPEPLSTGEEIHILCGIRGFPFTRKAYKKLKNRKCIILKCSESRDPRGLLGILRYFDSLVFESSIRSRIDGILSIGCTGREWFTRVGYDVDKIFDFGWTLNDSPNYLPRSSTLNDPIQFIYIGQFIKRKNVEALVRTFAQTVRPGTGKLRLIGRGPLRDCLSNIISKYGAGDYISIDNSLPHEEIERTLAVSDVLILPSRYDGWGAVVNEALYAGARVICSTTCGTAILNDQSLVSCFQWDNVEQLSSEIEVQLVRGAVSPVARAQQRLETLSRIGPLSVARYLQDTFNFVSGLSSHRPKYPGIVNRMN